MALMFPAKQIATRLCRIFSNDLHTTATNFGLDLREKRIGHIVQSDKVEGERDFVASGQSSFELIDEKLMDKVIDGMPFKQIPIVYIKCSRNNTKIRLLNGDGSLITRKTGGSEGYKNCRKGTTVAAQAVANRIISIATDNEISMARLVFSGLGPGRNPAFRVFELSNLKIVSLSDRTDAQEPWIKRPRAAKSL